MSVRPWRQYWQYHITDVTRPWRLNHLVKHTPCNHTLAFLGIFSFACPQSPPPLSPNSHPLGGLRRYSLGRTTMVPGTLELAESPAVPWLSKKGFCMTCVALFCKILPWYFDIFCTSPIRWWVRLDFCVLTFKGRHWKLADSNVGWSNLINIFFLQRCSSLSGIATKKTLLS